MSAPHDIVCSTCEAFKPPEEYYESNRSHCKACIRKRVRLRARSNPKVQEYDRLRAKRPKVRARTRQNTKIWREKNPQAYRAHTALGYALRSKKITREPCLFCGVRTVHAHHRDYSRPLDVVWLCPQCHHRLHAAFPETEGANKQTNGTTGERNGEQ